MYPYHYLLHTYSAPASSDLAAWAAAIGALLLFAITTFQVTKSLIDTRRREVRRQPESVSAWIADETGGGKNAWIALLNSSNEPVYQVIASVVSLRDTHASGDATSTPNHFRAYISVLPPGSHYARIDGGYRGLSFQPSVEVAFIDKTGKSWVRNGDGWLRQIDKKPHENYGLHEPLPWLLPKPILKDYPEYNQDLKEAAKRHHD
jgi:hypothetical protein